MWNKHLGNKQLSRDDYAMKKIKIPVITKTQRNLPELNLIPAHSADGRFLLVTSTLVPEYQRYNGCSVTSWAST